MYIGIDIGGTNLKVGLVNVEGCMIDIATSPLGGIPNGDALCKKMVELCFSLLEKNHIPREEIPYIGIGIPAAVSYKTDVIPRITNIAIGAFPIRELFQKYWDIPLILGNDAVCAAWGESLFGAGRGSRSFVIVTIGTGIGGGIIIHKKAFLSTNGVAGEVGHMVIVPEGEQCNCGRKGCWEQYASASALIRMTKEAMIKDKNTYLWQYCNGDLNNVEGKTAFEISKTGDPVAEAICERFCFYLSLGILNIINILQPDTIAIGGGVSNASNEMLLYPLRKMITGKSLASMGGVEETRIVKAQLGNDAGIIGAAFLKESLELDYRNES